MVDPVHSKQIQSALLFLGQLRRDAALRDGLASARSTRSVADLVGLGCARGFAFDEAALREAFVRDWQMRMAHWQLQARRSALPSDAQAGASA